MFIASLHSHQQLRRDFIQTQCAGGGAELGDCGGDDEATADNEEGDDGTYSWDERGDDDNADTSADMTDSIDQGEAGGAGTGGIALGGPGIRHRYPEIEADEENDRSNGGKPEVVGTGKGDKQAAQKREDGGDGQPAFALQPFAIGIVKEGDDQEADSSNC